MFFSIFAAKIQKWQFIIEFISKKGRKKERRENLISQRAKESGIKGKNGRKARPRGDSVGAFYNTLINSTRLPKVVFNPGMKPTTILPELRHRPDHPDDKAPTPEMIARYAPFESSVENNANHSIVNGLFAETDELSHDRFIPTFEAHYGKVRLIRGDHNEAVAKVICEFFS